MAVANGGLFSSCDQVRPFDGAIKVNMVILRSSVFMI